MFSNRLGIFTSLALAASAVLIPPSMSVEEIGDDQSLETLAIDPFKRTVALECPGCDFAVMKGDSMKWEAGMGNTFLLGFDISPHEDSLNIDGVRLFPPVLGGFGETFSVTQIDPTSETSLRLRITSYTYRLDGAETVSEDGNELLPLRFQIRAIEEKYVDLPELTINLLKDSEGRLMITSFEASQADQLPAEHEEKDCNEWPLFCQWKAIIANRLEKLKQMGKGCHKRPHGELEPNPMEKEGFEGKPPHRFRPGHEHPHHMGPHRHGHHGHDRMHVFLRRAFFTILVPILIGIFAGTLTYLIGMAIGCLIAITIAKIRGQDYQRIALEDGDETMNEAHDDGVVDMENDVEGHGEKAEYQELPAYEAPPQYEEDTLKEVKADDK